LHKIWIKNGGKTKRLPGLHKIWIKNGGKTTEVRYTVGPGAVFGRRFMPKSYLTEC